MGNKRASRSRCGVYDCSGCGLYLADRCPGCASGNLRLSRDGGEECLVYGCVREQEIAGCFECELSLCKLGSWPPTRCPLRERFGGEELGEAFHRQLEVTKGVATGRGLGIDRSEPRTLRLREYLQVVHDFARRNVATMSSHHLARCVGVRASLARRDLSELGHLGTPGRGYSVSAVGAALRESLSLGPRRSAIWLGGARQAGDKHVAEALEIVNCILVGIFDDDSEAQQVAGIAVRPLAEVAAAANTATVAILANEAATEPEVLRGLAEAGIEAVLNLTPVRLDASAKVIVEQADLGSQLLRLLSRLTGPGAGRAGRE